MRRPTPRKDGSFARAASWTGVCALMIGGVLVFWAFDALPFQDLPEHAGLIALRHRFAQSAFDQRFFVLAPHLGPYSLFRFLGDLLVLPLGPVGAVRAIATLPLVATPLALVWARRRLHSDFSPTGAYFGLALGFGFMTLLGFASYLLGVAVLIVALTAWLELLVAVDAKSPSAAKLELGIACTNPLVLLVHGHAFAVLTALQGVSALASGDRWRRLLRTRALAPALLLAAWVEWRERSSIVPTGSAPVPHAALDARFQGLFDKLSLLLTPTLMTRSGADALVGLGLWGVVIAAAVATARSPRQATGGEWPEARENGSRSHAHALLVSAIAVALAFLVLPHSIGWFGFVDGRLVPLMLLLPIMAVRRPSLGPRLAAAFDRVAPLAAGAMVSIAWIGTFLFQAEAVGWRQVLAQVPSNSKLLYLPLEPNSDVLTAHPFVHYDKLVMAERPIVVGDLWYHQGSGVYPTAANPALALPPTYSASDLRRVDWPAYRLEDWDLLLVRTRPLAREPWVPAPFALTARRGGWWLFCKRAEARP